jgi:hypothetical protein
MFWSILAKIASGVMAPTAVQAWICIASSCVWVLIVTDLRFEDMLRMFV